MASGKKYIEASKLVDGEKKYSLEDACALVVKTANKKFDETVDVSIRLGVDPKKADQNVRGSVPLPHGLGKEVRVAVFAQGEKVKEATDAGADVVGGDDLVEKIKEGFFEFDSVIATPDMMAQVGKVGKLLGPRGLMPSPKIGTVTFDVKQTIEAVKAGRAEYRVEKTGIVHAAVGKASFGPEKLSENIAALVSAVNKQKPQTSKGIYLKAASMSSSMGPGIAVDALELRGL